MFKVSWRAAHNYDRSSVWCENRDELSSMISLLEASDKVAQVKIEIAGHTIKDPYTELGMGKFAKFVSQFTYEDLK